MTDTLFSKIINREIPADIIYEDDEILGFNDINAQAPIHCLFIPKVAIKTVNDIKDNQAELIGKLFLAAKAYAKQMDVAESGYRLVMNCNADAGQTVFHIHLHFLAGRELSWPPG